jgi:hypothetical protein
MSSQLEHVATALPPAATPSTVVRSLWSLATRSINSALCGLQGHDPLLKTEEARLFLRCSACGYESPGWTETASKPRLRFTGDRARHRLN